VSSLVTLRPDGTFTTLGTVTLVGGGSTVHGNTSDNNNATRAKGGQDGASVELTLGDTTLSAVQRVKTATIRAVVARTAADLGHTQKAYFYLNDGVTPLAPLDTLGTSSSSVVTVTGQARSGLSGREFTQARVNGMRLGVQWYRWGAVEWLEVAELYVDLDVRTRPSVASVTVTGQTSTTRPTVSWTPTLDVDLQSRLQVRVFSAAQYGAGGFSPATSGSTWDSGVLLSTATSVVVGADLVNGTTYKAYVAVAQDWTGTPDAQWWSDWSAAGAVSSAFTISLTPPAAPSLSVSGITGVPGYRMLADVTAPVNLLTADNASFEGSLGQWAAETNCSVSRVTTDAADGTASMQMSSTAGGTMVANSGTEPFLDTHVKGGSFYTALGSARAGATGRTCRVGIRWRDAAGATISTSFGSTFSDVTGSYTQGTLTNNQAPANAKLARVVTEVQSTGGAAELHRWDKISLHQGASTVWTPGGMAGQTVTAERGERVAAGRGPAENWAHPDVAYAGSPKMTSGSGFALRNDSGRDILGWEYLDKDIPAGGPVGMIHWTPRSAAAADLLVGEFVYGGPAGEEWKFPAVVGSTHVWSFWAWVASGSLAVTPKIEWRGDDTTVTIGTPSGSPVTLTTTPQQVVVTGTCPATASAANGIITNHTSSATADVYLTRVGWGLGTTAVDDRPPSGGPLVWSPVRGVSAAQLAGFPFGYDTGQRQVFADPEYPPARPVLYRARQTVTLSGQAVSSANSAYATAYLAPPARTILRDVRHPERAVVAGIAPGDERAVAEDAQVFHPLGRDGRPVKVRDWLSGHDGSWAVTVLSDAELAALEALLASPTELLVQHSEGGQTYLLVTGYSCTRVVRSALHRVSVSYLETGRP